MNIFKFLVISLLLLILVIQFISLNKLSVMDAYVDLPIEEEVEKKVVVEEKEPVEKKEESDSQKALKSSSMEALLNNPENKKLLKSKK